MDALMAELARSVPALLVLVYIVYVFIKHLEKQQTQMMQMHIENLAARHEAAAQLNRNTDLLSRVLEQLRTCTSDDSDATTQGDT